MFKIYYKIPLCYLSLHSDGKFLTRVDFCDNKRSEKKIVKLCTDTKTQIRI
ncbi:hypothetical protein B11447_10740 [Campylobacter jejuni]|nr:hypothetical protein B11447_10740 [Campylobacter jejuni]